MSHERTVILWCQKADNDLKNAHHEVEHKDPALDTAYFHAQQVAEIVRELVLSKINNG